MNWANYVRNTPNPVRVPRIKRVSQGLVLTKNFVREF